MKILTFFLFAVFFFFTQQILFSQTVDFFQDNIIFYDRISSGPDTTINSYFGRVNLTFISSDTIKYFNLSVSGAGITNNYPIRNYPVKSLDSVGHPESRYFSFLINDTNSTGVNIDSIHYGFSLTNDTVPSAPIINSIASVSDFNFIIFNGFIDNHPVIESHLLNSKSQIDISGNTAPGYRIQDCDVDECMPAALSDAAKYLQKIYPLPFLGKDSLITIYQMKTYTQWVQQGVYLYLSNGHFFNEHVNNEFSSNLVPMIMSGILDSLSSEDIDNIIIPALNQYKAVPFFINYEYRNPNSGSVSNTKHAISLREITKIRDDIYTFTFSHDATQGIPGGTIVESALYSPLTHTISLPDISNVSSSANEFPASSSSLNSTDLGCVVIAKNEVPLPVEFASFTSKVNKRDVKLIWTTTYELNNAGFEVQSSLNGAGWIKRGFVYGYGNSKLNQTYFYEDRNLNSGSYKYRLKQLDFNGNIQYYFLSINVIIGIPQNIALEQNYPNPFNPSTKINYDIPKDGIVILKIFDLSGREIKTLINEFKPAGYYTIDINGINLSSGVYFYVLESGGFYLSKKMIVVR